MLHSGRAAIGTVATPVDGIYQGYSNLTLHNDDNTDAVFIGGADVTPSNGLTLRKEDTVQFELAPLEQLFVVSTKAGHTISFLRQTI
jgi:hypothetical protein